MSRRVPGSRRLREWPTDDPELGDGRDLADPESELLDAERRVVLQRALATLPGRHREIVDAQLASLFAHGPG